MFFACNYFLLPLHFELMHIGEGWKTTTAWPTTTKTTTASTTTLTTSIAAAAMQQKFWTETSDQLSRSTNFADEITFWCCCCCCCCCCWLVEVNSQNFLKLSMICVLGSDGYSLQQYGVEGTWEKLSFYSKLGKLYFFENFVSEPFSLERIKKFVFSQYLWLREFLLFEQIACHFLAKTQQCLYNPFLDYCLFPPNTDFFTIQRPLWIINEMSFIKTTKLKDKLTR